MSVLLKIRNLTKEKDNWIFEEIVFDKSEFIYVEDVVFHVTSSLGITNVYAHLFAFYYRPEGVWLCPNQELTSLLNDLNLRESSVELDLRIRFRPSLEELKLKKCDSKALNYYFLQIRDEFLNLKKGKYNQEQHFPIMVGIAMQDVMRIVLEKNIDNHKEIIASYLVKIYDYCPTKPGPLSYFSLTSFTPYSFRQKLISTFFNNFNRDLDVDTIKFCYIEQYFEFLEKTNSASPLDEIYDIDIASFKTITHEHKKQIIFHSEKQCLSTRELNTKTWRPLLPIKELMSITVLGDTKLQIYHEKAAPLVMTMQSQLHLKSFISLLSGYYHLCEHWNFNICQEYFSPFLDRLRRLSCFGPIENSVVQSKIVRFQKELMNNNGLFIFHQQPCTNFTSFKIVYERDNSLQYCKIEFNILAKNPIFRIEDDIFHSYEDLINHVKVKKNLTAMIAPKENDILPNLLVCSNELSERMAMTNGVSNPLVIAKSEELTRTKLTLVNHVNFSITLGTYTTNQGKIRVMFKEFTKFVPDKQILKEIEDWIHLKEPSIVNGKGLILNPLTVLLEHCPNMLRELYQNKEVTLQETNRIEAVYSLAKALEYLFTSGMPHGYIRFDNLYVSTFNGKFLSIKLGDPIGFASNLLNERPWLSPEFVNYNSLVYNKVTSCLDVWAFATTVWEIFNNGEKPEFGHEVVEMSPDSLLFMIPPELMQLVKECWNKDYNYRIQASSILRDMCQILAVIYEKQKREATHDYCHIAGEPEVETLDKPLTNHSREYSFAASQLSKFASFRRKYYSRSGSTSSVVSGQTDTTTLPQDDTISLLQTNDGDFKIYDESHIIPQGQVQLSKLIGKGTYGFVFKSFYNNDEYAAKTIIEDNTVDFDEEIRIMSKVKHKNIVQVFRCAKIGIEQILPLLDEDAKLLFCKKVPSANGYVKYQPVISECKAVLMELVDVGALNDYISRKYRMGNSDLPLLKYAHDIASGLEYLASKNIIHRDLATRNILINSDDQVKISDFGLAHILEGDHYKYKRQLKLPILWYAPESLTRCIFQIKSDVWSFGVLLWELYTFCLETPYSELNLDFTKTNPDTLLKILSDKLTRENIRLGKPHDCPKPLYQLMLDCWNFDPQNRPDPSTLLDRLRELCIYSNVDLY